MSQSSTPTPEYVKGSDTPKLTLTGWLQAVDDYWTKDGTLCGNCDFNDPDQGCEMLYAPSVPAGECEGILRRHGIRQPEEA